MSKIMGEDNVAFKVFLRVMYCLLGTLFQCT